MGRARHCDYRKFSPRTTGFLERLWVSIQRATRTMALPFETCRDGRGRPAECSLIDRGEISAAISAYQTTKRRVAGIGGVIPRPEESLPRAPVSAIPLPWAPGRLCPRLNAYVTADTTQQRNTHNIESREVRYPWHPWCGRVVAVHQTFAKNGWVVSHCSIEENAEARHLEIPEWMFDPVICRRMQLAAVPTVSCEALLDLKSLLRCAPCPDTDVVLQPQHRSLLSPGGADAKIIKSQGRSIHTVSSTTQKSGVAGIASRNKTESSETLRATAARVLRKTPRRRPQRGGGR
jgi:hypothetical protein